MNHELPDAQAGFRKGRRTKDQIANIRWIIKKARSSRKTSTSALLTMLKSSCRSQQTVENSSKVEIPDHLTCLLRNLYAGQEATVITRNGTTLVPNWERRTSRLYPVTCLFNLYAESVPFSSVAQSCPTHCDPMYCSTPGLPVQQLLEFTQTHVHRPSDAIQSSHPLSSPFLQAFNLSQHQDLFK